MTTPQTLTSPDVIDRRTRLRALISSAIGSAVEWYDYFLYGTMAGIAMGLLPTYESVGIWAPILLVALRLVQGLALGGEWGGGLLLAVEYAPREKRGLYGAVPQTGALAGLALGARLSTTKPASRSWRPCGTTGGPSSSRSGPS